MAITGGELLARCFAAEGVRFVFGLPSPEIDPFLAALGAQGIRHVPVRHEAAGVHMAEGLYKTTGQVAVVLGNPGPGSANLLPGVTTARHEGVPVVAVTSQHRLGLVYPSPPTTFQGQDQLDVFRAAVKWGAPILAFERIAEVVRMAFRELWLGRPGPVQLEVPAPVLYANGEAPQILPPERYRAPLPVASDAQLALAAQWLAEARRPLVLGGGGVDRAGANAALLAIAERLACPMLGTMAGRSALPIDHASWLHPYSDAADLARRESDVVLVAGSRLGNLDLPFDKYWGDGAAQRVIQIDVDARHIGVSRPIALGIVADLGDALPRLDAALAEHKPLARSGADLERYREKARAWRDAQAGALARWSGSGLHPAHVMLAIGRAFGGDAIYATDGGNTSLWAHALLPATRPRSYLNILELGMLGTGIPSAIGAKLGNPEREVVCVTGDGAAGFNFMEMQSAAREGLRLTTVVMAEGSWTMEEPNEQALYGRTFGTAMGAVRWDQVAEGLGCTGFYAEDVAGVEAALERARAANGPSVICARTARDANLSISSELLRRFVEVYQGPTG
jgi:acetolactate synthase-1/2/3 large subunit